MKKKVSIVTSGHSYYDERIFYKFARSLNKNGYEVSIICSTVETEIDFIKDNIHIIGFNGSSLKKTVTVNKFSYYLQKIEPNVIICCEPLPILAANKLRKNDKKLKIIYDVTEWYPENVAFKLSCLRKIITYISLFIYNVYASNLVDAIIIGERGKKRRYDLLVPFKKKQIISYYPVIEFFHSSLLKSIGAELTLCYAGLLKFDRGIKQILKVSECIAAAHRELKVKLKLIGKFESHQEEIELVSLINKSSGVEVEICGWTEYHRISDKLSDVHICFDLRESNFVYNNSLPIKIFEYMACGKPFIFSDIKPIRNEIEFEDCGFLIHSNNITEIVDCVEKYLNEQSLWLRHSKNGRALCESKYNWEMESVKLLSFIESLLEAK